MTTSKLYYADPIAAAYMAREFGVIIQTWHLDNGVCPKRERWWDMSAQDCAKEFAQDVLSDKYHIHPKSLHIFEPQAGDLLGDGHENAFGKCAGKQIIEVPLRHNGKGFYELSTYQLSIIQRNGKPFFWPESEEA